MNNPVFRAAIYARYSSPNQREQSIDDQLMMCRRKAKELGYTVIEEHIHYDKAQEGSKHDRKELNILLQKAKTGMFNVILVDDLARLARDCVFTLTTIDYLLFHGVRVVSAADGLDTSDPNHKLQIRMMAIFYEQQLDTVGKNTFRGQYGQRENGFFTGDNALGYKPVEVGPYSMDKHGRRRPKGYDRAIVQEEAEIVLRIFREFVEGKSELAIAKTFNEEKVPGKYKAENGWSVSTIYRMLDNEKYIGRFWWNRNGSVREPITNKRKKIAKPREDWHLIQREDLRIVPQDLWDKAQERKKELHKVWPGVKNKTGFETQAGSRFAAYPKDLLSGAMFCGVCGAAIVKVGGKDGGYYGCSKGRLMACDNHTIVKKVIAERSILKAVREKLSTTENLAYVFRRVKSLVEKKNETIPDDIRKLEGEIEKAMRCGKNLIDCIREGHSELLAPNALKEEERKITELTLKMEALRGNLRQVFTPPTMKEITGWVESLQEILEEKTIVSANLLRRLLGKIELVPETTPDGKKYLKAVSNLQILELLEWAPNPSGRGPEKKTNKTSSDAGSTALRS